MSSAHAQPPSPVLFFDTINAYHRTAALKAALELEVFTAIDEAGSTADEVASRCKAAPRGIRILCDFLTIIGFLTKENDRYSLTPDSAMFLSRNSPAYAGAAVDFLLSPGLTQAFNDLAGAVRKGGTTQPEGGTIAPEHSVWIRFAESMGPMMAGPAQAVAELVQLGSSPARVLDVSASHGMYGLAFARKYPNANIVALDWAPVLEVARRNAEQAGVAARYTTIAGDAFTVDLGNEYDAVLIPNFLHHFSEADCVAFLKRVHAALRQDGKVVIVEFVPNPDRITPPEVATFSLIMLGTTPAGDAYTFEELNRMVVSAGFKPAEQPALLPGTATAVIAAK